MEEEVMQEIENKEEAELVEGYKIRAGNTYYVNRQEYNGNVFYKIPVIQKNYDGTTVTLYKNVVFKDKPDIADNTKIRIKKFVENGYYKKNDKNHYNPMFVLMIYDWEIVEQSSEQVESAYNDYQNAINQDDVPLW